MPGIINVLRSDSLAIAVTRTAEALHEEHTLYISLRLPLWIVVDDFVYLLIREIDRLHGYCLRSEYLSERRAWNVLRRIVLTYNSLDGGTYGLCRVGGIVFLDLLKEVTEVVVGDVFPQWLVAQKLLEHSRDLDELRIFPDIRSVECIMPPCVAVIVCEPSLLDRGLVFLLLNGS